MKKTAFALFIAFLLFSCKGGEPVDREKPVFSKKSKDSVLLRYNYGKGRKDIYRMISDMKMHMSVMGRVVDIPMKMTMGYSLTGSPKNSDGNYDIRMKITSFAMDAPKQGISYNSASQKTSSSFPGGEAFRQILNKPIKMTITPRGKTLKADMDGILAGLSGNKMVRKIVVDMIDNMKRTGMGQFPEKPVKAGDRFKAIEYSQNLQGMMKLDISLSYEVESISADKKKVILKPDMKMKFSTKNARMKIKVKDVNMSGWMLFSTETGQVERSKMKITMEFSVEVMGQSADARMDMISDLKLQ